MQSLIELDQTPEKSALRTYSDVLQLRGDALRELLHSSRGVAYALKLFVVVALIAGLGRLFGLPVVLRQVTLGDVINQSVTTIEQTGGFIGTSVLPAILSGNVLGLPARIAESVQNQVAEVTARLRELLPFLPLPNVPSASTSPSQAAQDSTDLTPLRPMIDAMNVSDAQFRRLLEQAQVTPAQLSRTFDLLNLSPAKVGEWLRPLAAAPDRLNKLAEDIGEEGRRLEPPLGWRSGNVARLIGQWLSTPLQWIANWLLLGLVMLLVARALGGRATAAQHIAALAIASAPLVLLVFSTIPNLSVNGVTTVPIAFAIQTFGRVLTLIGGAWCVALLVKSLSVAHGFSLWRAGGTIALAWLSLNILLPLLGAAIAAFLLSP